MPQTATSTANVSSDTDPVLGKVLQLLDDFSLDIRSSVSDGIAQGFATQRTSDEQSGVPSHQITYEPHPSLLGELRNLLSDPNATFKTPEQAEGLEVAVTKTEHLLLVGPTAMGKSLVYMLPSSSALYDRNLVTIVLLPLSSLHADFRRRCQQLHIPSSRWFPPPFEPQKTSIMYVSPEHAQTRKFLEYALSLHLSNKLARFVIDEPHLILQHADFRYCFANLKPLITAGEFFFSTT